MHQVRYFLAVANHLNFTRAADALCVAQPSLTRAIQKLEAELQGPLFRRERANTHLTELGQVMLPYLQAAFDAAEAAKRQARIVQKREAGSLSLGVCAGIDARGPAELVFDIIRNMENVEVSVEIAEPEAIERRLIGGDFDAALMAPVSDLRERFDLHVIHDDAMVVAFANGHDFARHDRVELEALDGEPLIERTDCHFEKALAAIMHQRGVTRIVRHNSNDPCWTAEFVRSGLGCAIMPAAMAASHSLQFRVLDGLTLRHATMLATVRGRRYSTALAALMQSIRQRSRS
ncbi:LysR family transcriptional regulator [Lichenifustis flavocetrariae]|uniref:LysR family transcriptional regulator n=1 Tax=Lichenifustis flavocetrariae TaxID=2949735 RepID=A0AA42CQK9_9HYPH|nr:LysR family transcriptional regulator [Lichenifustis flavocetrariae]MCW6511540.1 LysR family transcriptional regulator [Lichenifustis flavocetrariae]